MVMGIVYLMYSAYFIGEDVDGMITMVNLMLAAVYFILGIINYRALFVKIRTLNAFLAGALVENEAPESFCYSVKLKLKMLRRLNWVMIFFYAPMFFFFLFSTMNSGNQFAI